MARIGCVVVVCAFLLAPGVAWSQDQSLSPSVPQSLSPLVPPSPSPLVTQSFSPSVPELQSPRAARRPASLLPMYVSFGVLQGLDYVTTRRALANGSGREANPVMGPVVGNQPAFLAVKAGTTAVTVWMAERMWKKHPARAIALIAAANGAMGIVVAHNARIR